DPRQVKGKGAALPRCTLDLDLAAEQPRDFPADREPQPRPAVLPARRPIRLLKGFEDDLLLVEGNADAGIDDREGHDAIGLVERSVFRPPPGKDFSDLK